LIGFRVALSKKRAGQRKTLQNSHGNLPIRVDRQVALAPILARTSFTAPIAEYDVGDLVSVKGIAEGVPQ
jgi:hypothetical protein